MQKFLLETDAKSIIGSKSFYINQNRDISPFNRAQTGRSLTPKFDLPASLVQRSQHFTITEKNELEKQSLNVTGLSYQNKQIHSQSSYYKRHDIEIVQKQNININNIEFGNSESNNIRQFERKIRRPQKQFKGAHGNSKTQIDEGLSPWTMQMKNYVDFQGYLTENFNMESSSQKFPQSHNDSYITTTINGEYADAPVKMQISKLLNNNNIQHYSQSKSGAEREFQFTENNFVLSLSPFNTMNNREINELNFANRRRLYQNPSNSNQNNINNTSHCQSQSNIYPYSTLNTEPSMFEGSRFGEQQIFKTQNVKKDERINIDNNNSSRPQSNMRNSKSQVSKANRETGGTSVNNFFFDQNLQTIDSIFHQKKPQVRSINNKGSQARSFLDSANSTLGNFHQYSEKTSFLMDAKYSRFLKQETMVPPNESRTKSPDQLQGQKFRKKLFQKASRENFSWLDLSQLKRPASKPFRSYTLLNETIQNTPKRRFLIFNKDSNAVIQCVIQLIGMLSEIRLNIFENSQQSSVLNLMNVVLTDIQKNQNPKSFDQLIREIQIQYLLYNDKPIEKQELDNVFQKMLQLLTFQALIAQKSNSNQVQQTPVEASTLMPESINNLFQEQFQNEKLSELYRSLQNKFWGFQDFYSVYSVKFECSLCAYSDEGENDEQKQIIFSVQQLDLITQIDTHLEQRGHPCQNCKVNAVFFQILVFIRSPKYLIFHVTQKDPQGPLSLYRNIYGDPQGPGQQKKKIVFPQQLQITTEFQKTEYCVLAYISKTSNQIYYFTYNSTFEQAQFKPQSALTTTFYEDIKFLIFQSVA